MLGSIPREIADVSANFQFTIQKNEMKYFVLEQINKKKPQTILLRWLEASTETIA